MGFNGWQLSLESTECHNFSQDSSTNSVYNVEDGNKTTLKVFYK
jgi:hypothetical protein